MLTHGSWSVILGGQPRPRSRGRTQRPPNFKIFCMHAHSTRNNNRILHGDQTRCEAILHSWPRMLTRDLFVVANLLVYYCLCLSRQGQNKPWYITVLNRVRFWNPLNTAGRYAYLIEGLRERTEPMFLFSAHHSLLFYFRCSVYWWKGSVRF